MLLSKDNLRKVCLKCGQEKAEEEFYRQSSSTQKLRSQCKVCINTANLARQANNPKKYNARTYAWRAKNPGRTTANIRAWQIRNPERYRQNIYRFRYKIDFDSLWEDQNGKCAVCCKPMLRGGQEPTSVCVDHDRQCCPKQKSCGRCVRGLVHWRCNLVLAYAQDDSEILRSAVIYLERWRTTRFQKVFEPSTLPNLAPVGKTPVGIGASRAWQLRNPERCKLQAYKSKFRIDFSALWKSQSGNCHSCGRPMLREGKAPTSVCVDHDRSCCPGKKSCGQCVRGLIHRNCNIMLGYAREDANLLLGASSYLESCQSP